ncbi:protein-export membrane protein SecD [candidate division WOR-3 bacterium 4484_100]|uniref:Protein translocase subunit SecD n=1 Tax=candidate division WOR-3 bacterium 4484_100 TaxID=1936077 RepID=A0A1V4QFL6_UNCW3|nr:MAG: protein-export membrane protein SecD [candidate division WOR-3 bacterium 4484_100]
MRNLGLRVGIVIFAVGLAIYAVIPTIRLYTEKNLSEEAKISLSKRAIHLGLDLKGGMHLVLEVDTTGLKENPKDLRDRAFEVIQNRIDQFGVYEPVIEKQSGGRILVQLPGVDRDRAINLIKRVAHLEFKLVADDQFQDVIQKMDKFLSAEDTLAFEEPFSSYLLSIGRQPAIDVRDEDSVRALISQAKEVIPEGLEFLFGPKEESGNRNIKKIYLLKKTAELTGEGIRDAQHRPNQSGQLQYVGSWEVDIQFKRSAARKFASITGRNVNKRLAIVLDGVVQSAPYIQERIPHGRARITGNFTAEQARDLAIVLRAGALPAPLKIIEERSVGPSLGRDSIQSGMRAVLIASALVILFMLIYYSLSGLVADIALFLNLFFLLAVLSAFHGSLTMPGIAGIALTIGMAVDANVLIFERIREELKIGKTTRTAIDQGFARAWITIFDSNITTIIIGVILFIFGSGPIKGFALTLTIGLLSNLFSAVFIGKVIFNYFTYKFDIRKLKI